MEKKSTLGSKFALPLPMPLLSKASASNAQVDFLRKECAVKQVTVLSISPLMLTYSILLLLLGPCGVRDRGVHRPY